MFFRFIHVPTERRPASDNAIVNEVLPRLKGIIIGKADRHHAAVMLLILWKDSLQWHWIEQGGRGEWQTAATAARATSSSPGRPFPHHELFNIGYEYGLQGPGSFVHDRRQTAVTATMILLVEVVGQGCALGPVVVTIVLTFPHEELLLFVQVQTGQRVVLSSQGLGKRRIGRIRFAAVGCYRAIQPIYLIKVDRKIKWSHGGIEGNYIRATVLWIIMARTIGNCCGCNWKCEKRSQTKKRTCD
jgi:hypothetical protein